MSPASAQPVLTLQQWRSPSGKIFAVAPLRQSYLRRSSLQQAYTDACAAVGLRPVVSGYSVRGAPEYCEQWDCMQTADWNMNLWYNLGPATGWLHDCDGNFDSCACPTLVVFSPYDSAHGEQLGFSTGGGLMNSVDGVTGDAESGWGEALRPVCGRELP